MSTGANWHLPFMDNIAGHIDQVNLSTSGLWRYQRKASAGQCWIVSDEAYAAAALRYLINCCAQNCSYF
jgi:hypothetical protein